jgi:hypothetical protein
LDGERPPFAAMVHINFRSTDASRRREWPGGSCR